MPTASRKHLFGVLVFAAALLLPGPRTAEAQSGTVRVWEAPVTFQTWKLGAPERMPVWKVRGGNIYPYPMFDKLTEERADRTYHGLWLENEYVKALVLPEIGGRLHDAYDKTAGGYHFLQDQRTIKPALVGMAGAWISGGIEWNFPQGHRPSGFRPVDWRIEANPDGSRTVWTGETERTCGMRWAVGNTLHPGRTWVETKVRLSNTTPYPQAFLWWADAGVRGSPEFQAVIPGEIATGHGKHEYYHWPVDQGKDLRRWANAPGGTSYFIVGSTQDYHGGYSPEEQGGLAHWADHNIVRGKKLWFCGTSPAGRLWETVLTDNDAPLVEPQAGAYSDNQPDYHWIMPGETKVFSHFWFPVRKIGYWDYANLEGAVSLKLEKGKVKIGWSPTGATPGVSFVIRADGREIYRQVMDADPAHPVLVEVTAPKGVDLYSLRLEILSAAADTLLAFSHPRPTDPALPEPEPPYAAPEKVKSNEKLFLIGDYYERFREPARAETYYQEALRRDTGDIRSNIALGLMLLKQGRYAEAATYFQTALARDPESGRAHYFLGMADIGQGRSAPAEAELARASYDLEFYSAANLRLACLAASEGRREKSLEYAERAVRGNGDNSEARGMLALALNRLGRHDEALSIAVGVQSTDPLDYLSAAERVTALTGLSRESEAANCRDTLMQLLRGDSYNRIELAVRYARCGMYPEAVRALKMTDGQTEENSPLVLYYRAWCSHIVGDSSGAAQYLVQAAGASQEYCFPSRPESLPVLEWACAAAPSDPLARYLLGNLMFSLGRGAEAMRVWERATELDRSLVEAWRNLGYARAEAGDLAGARSAYEGAVAADPAQAVPLTELDQVLDRLEVSREERLACLESHRATACSTDPSIKRLISLYVQLGRSDEALGALRGHRFHSWEGGYDVHRYWVEANLMQGDRALDKGDAVAALGFYRLALIYPDSLEVKAQPGAQYTRENYKVATALEALGRRSEARRAFSAVIADSLRPGSAAQYFRGLALAKLGRGLEARALFESLLDRTAESPAGKAGGGLGDGLPYSEKVPLALACYRRSLALEGLGRSGEAKVEREKALDLDPIVALRAFGPPQAGW